MSGPRPVRAPRGPELTCRGWSQEAALRMLMNNLDPEVAEDPDHLVVYGGTGRAARSWDAFDAIVRELRVLADDETLLVQSGKPVGVLRTHAWAPRVLIANSNLVGRWATWDHFRELERAGLMMYGQMTAGSWIYIGTQGILQGTYETFAEAARQHFGGTLRGTVTLTAGLGGMGGAQPLAVTMNDGVCIAIEVDPARARRRLEIRYVDRLTEDPAEALGWARDSAARGEAVSIALIGNAAEIEPAWAGGGRALRPRHRPDLRARPARRIRARRDQPRGRPPAARDPARRVRPPVHARDGGPLPGHARIPGRRCRHVRLWQQPASPCPGSRGRRRIQLSGVRAGVHPPAVLRGSRSVPVGSPQRGSGRYPAHGSGDPRAVPRRRRIAPLDRDGPGAGAVPGPAGADLLARLRRAGEGRARLQRARPHG